MDNSIVVTIKDNPWFNGVVLPTKDQVLLGNTDFMIIEDGLLSLQKFIEYLLDDPAIVFEMIHTPTEEIEQSSIIWDFMVTNRHRLYTKHTTSGYIDSDVEYPDKIDETFWINIIKATHLGIVR